MIRTELSEEVHIVTMDAGENSFDLQFATQLMAAIEEAAGTPGALVITGTDRYFSSGLNLDWLSTAEPAEAGAAMDRIHDVLLSLIRFPGVTVAAINGHAFGAGAILAAATDFRVMRADRGYFCLPEVDLGLAMSDEFDAVLQDAFERQALRRALLSGSRYGGEEASDLGFVDHAAAVDEVVPTAVGIARQYAGKDGRTVAALRGALCRRAISVLDRVGLPS